MLRLGRPCAHVAVLVVLLGGLAVPASGAVEAAKKHPRLVSGTAARCATCHGKLIEGRKTVHAATEDCTACHKVDIQPDATRITLEQAEPALCLTCHGELEAAAKGTLAHPHPPVADSCLACHDPHATDQPRLLKNTQSALCGDCHDAAGLQPKHGKQLTAATTCTTCHAPHGSANAKLLVGKVEHPPFADRTCDACHREPMGDRVRLQARGDRLCLACHDDPAAAGKQGGSVHGALRGEGGGRASCLSCHVPHVGERPKLLVAAATDLCARCHAAIATAARAKTGHAPAAKDCTSCHLPHSSAQPTLLKTPRAALCATCHDLAKPPLRAKHLGADLAKLDCLGCHSPHGEANPKLLARTLHPPVLDGCDTCHAGAFDKLKEGGGPPLCLECHSEVGEAAKKAAVQHPALEMGACTQCHNPHATAQAKLIKAPAGKECAECHAEQTAGPGEVAHGVIAWIGCEACHEPHGGGKRKLLRKEGSELCLACHAPDAAQPGEKATTVELLGRFPIAAAKAAALARIAPSPDGQHNHPVNGHRALGKPSKEELLLAQTSFKDELTCLTCHDPHKGKTARLLRWGAASALDACQHCHAK